MENSMEVFKKLNTELLYDPEIPLLGIYLEETKISNSKKMYVQFTAALFAIIKTWKQPKCPWTHKWIKKM